MVVFEDVLIPWERVFLHNNVAMANKLFTSASIQNNTGHQTAVRGLAKCKFMAALAIAHVALGQDRRVPARAGATRRDPRLSAAYRGRAAILRRQKAEPTESGAVRPAWPPLQSHSLSPAAHLRAHGAGGAGDRRRRAADQPDAATICGSEIGARHRRLLSRARASTPRRRIHLAKLAWDATGTQFGQRMLQYERYYAGDPVRVAATLYQRQNVDELMALVDRALSDDVMKV